MNFGRYKVISQLGQGGMASVYLGEDPSLNRLVAIKVIKADLMEDTSLLDRFSTEARTIAALRDPHIVEIFDVGIQNGQPFIIMEYMDNCSLQQIKNSTNSQPLPPDFTAACLCQAAEGLIEAHSKNIIHRDIKPENLLFNNKGYLKITDFGIVHLAGPNSNTTTGTILGSPNFMSPEQVEGTKPTSQSDMWSLGVVLYFCTTGCLPFNAPNLTAILRNICDHSFTPIKQLVPDADDLFDSLINTLLQKDPSKRGEGAKWLASELNQYLVRHNVSRLECTSNYLPSVTPQFDNTIIEDIPSQPNKIPLKPGLAKDHVFSQSNTVEAQNTGNSASKSGKSIRSIALLSGAGIILISLMIGLYLFNRSLPGENKISAYPVKKEVAETKSPSPEEEKQANSEKKISEKPGQKTIASTKEAKSVVKTKPTFSTGSAYLQVNSSPSFATVKVNGEVWAKTPMNTHKKIPSGAIQLEIIHRRYDPVDTTLRLRGGQKKSIKINLK